MLDDFSMVKCRIYADGCINQFYKLKNVFEKDVIDEYYPMILMFLPRKVLMNLLNYSAVQVKF